MKPTAPPMVQPVEGEDEASIHAEVLRLCDERERDGRITLPAPPSPEALRASTPFPPRNDEDDRVKPLDTVPAPPPSASRKRTESGVVESGGEDSVPSTIPGPPPVPRIVGM